LPIHAAERHTDIAGLATGQTVDFPRKCCGCSNPKPQQLSPKCQH
jgi:hypothetical protein